MAGDDVEVDAASEGLLAAAGRLARVGGWHLVLPDRALTWTREVYDIVEPDDLSRPPADLGLGLYHRDDAARLDAALEQAAATGEPFTLESWLTSFAGRRLRVRIRGEAARDTNGGIVALRGAFQDITELSETRDHAERTASQLADALESMTDAFYLLDEEWRFSFLNRRAGELLQVPSGELIGRVVWEAFPGAVGTLLETTYRRAVATGRPQRMDDWFFEPLDTWFEVHAYPSANGLAVYFRDTTEQRRLAQQAIQSQRMESLGTLAGGMAHDLNNVLAPVVLAAELLATEETDPRRTELLATIQASIARAGDMITQVLTFARGAEGARQEVDLLEVVRDVVAIARETFPHDIRIEVAAAADAATIVGDATQLHQVVTNLFVNARDAMEFGGTLRCEVATTDVDEQYAAEIAGIEPGRYVCVEVEDTGVGMAPEVLTRVFEPFFTTKPRGEGTGLGLSTAMAIVQGHRGQLRAYSEAGRGTRFRLEIPAAVHPVPVAAPTETPELPRATGTRVLLVEDEDAVRRVTRATLESHGYTVVEAADGAEGFAVFAGDPDGIAIVVSDVMMPVMDGAAMVHAVRRIRADVPVVITSGLQASGSARRLIESAHTGFVAKPYTAKALLRSLHGLLVGAADETDG